MFIQQPVTVAQEQTYLFGLALIVCAPVSETGFKLAFQELHGSSMIHQELRGKVREREYRITA